MFSLQSHGATLTEIEEEGEYDQGNVCRLRSRGDRKRIVWDEGDLINRTRRMIGWFSKVICCLWGWLNTSRRTATRRKEQHTTKVESLLDFLFPNISSSSFYLNPQIPISSVSPSSTNHGSTPTSTDATRSAINRLTLELTPAKAGASLCCSCCSCFGGNGEYLW